MTLQELYQSIGGDYEQAIRVLRMEKLLDKHIRKFAQNSVVENVLAAGETMDPTALFETAHAAKGVCANLGLKDLSDAAGEITEEFRPGTPRSLSDDEVRAKLQKIAARYAEITAGISAYENG
jgi:HPt (histidine-containing phosphotransfer) domain-containing protein